MKIFLGWTIYIVMAVAGVKFIYDGLSDDSHILSGFPELLGGVFLYWIGSDIRKNLNC